MDKYVWIMTDGWKTLNQKGVVYSVIEGLSLLLAKWETLVRYWENVRTAYTVSRKSWDQLLADFYNAHNSNSQKISAEAELGSLVQGDSTVR